MALTDVIARLAVSLGMDTTAFTTGANKAQVQATGFQKHMSKVAGAVSGALAGMVSWEVVTQLRDMTQAAVDAAGGLGEEAAALGVTTTELQEFRYAATQVGLSSEEMGKGLEQLTRRLGEAAQGVKAPNDALAALGLSLEDLQGKSRGEQITIIADGMKAIEDPTLRAAIAVDLFGRAGQRMSALLEGGASGVNDLRQAAHDLGIVLTESEIANADVVADKVAKLRYVMEAQQNKKLLENADALLQYEQAVGDLKLGLIELSNNIGPAFSNIEQYSAGIGQAIYKNITLPFIETMDNITASVRNMVSDIGEALGRRLNAIWSGVKAKIDQVGDWFHGLYMRVVGNSDVPDMVDGIAAEMRRLDAVMVEPVRAATSAAQESFREMAQNTQLLLDRLFPEVRRLLDYRADLATISNLPAGQQDEARRRLGIEFGGGGNVEPTLRDIGPLVPEMDKIGRAIEGLTEKAQINTVRIAKSFKDMADDTLSSLGQLSQSIKSGGFLGILQSVVGLGLQLGSAGLFGKSIAGRINSPAPISTPQLVAPIGTPRIATNDNSGARALVEIVDTTGLFVTRVNGQIANAAPAIANAGASMAQSQLAFRQSRRIA